MQDLTAVEMRFLANIEGKSGIHKIRKKNDGCIRRKNRIVRACFGNE